eukprot:226063_1
MATTSDILTSFALVLMLLSFFIVLAMLLDTLIIFYCPKCFNKDQYTQPTLYFQLTSIISYILGIACITCDTLHVSHSWTNSTSLLDDQYIPLRMFSNSFSFHSYIFMDLVILGRLYYTFRDSVYKLSSFTSWTLFIMLSIIIICDIAYIFTFIPPFEGILYLPRILLSTSLIIETIVSVVMSGLFSYKLHQLLTPSSDFEQETKLREVSKSYLSQSTPNKTPYQSNQTASRITHHERMRSSSNSEEWEDLDLSEKSFMKQCIMPNFKLNTQQKDLIDLCTKHALITGIAATYFFMRFCWRLGAVELDHYWNNQLIWVSCYMSRTYVFVANGIAVYFGFVFASKLYYRLLGRCHVCLGQCCSRSVKKKIAHSAWSKILREYDSREPATMELKLNESTKSYHTLSVK